MSMFKYYLCLCIKVLHLLKWERGARIELNSILPFCCINSWSHRRSWKEWAEPLAVQVWCSDWDHGHRLRANAESWLPEPASLQDPQRILGRTKRKKLQVTVKRSHYLTWGTIVSDFFSLLEILSSVFKFLSWSLTCCPISPKICSDDPICHLHILWLI